MERKKSIKPLRQHVYTDRFKVHAVLKMHGFQRHHRAKVEEVSERLYQTYCDCLEMDVKFEDVARAQGMSPEVAAALLTRVMIKREDKVMRLMPQRAMVC